MDTGKWRRKMALLIAALALVLIGISAEAGNTPCSCDELTVSGAGSAAINATYTYADFISLETYWAGMRMWLGPVWTGITMPGYTLNWAVLRLPGSAWVSGVVVAFDGTEHAIYVVTDGYYMNQSGSLCPPETGWVDHGSPPAPTITSTCCWYGGIGDVNNDGNTDLLDVRLIYSHVSGVSSLPANMLDRADLDKDGDVDLDDAQILAEELDGICR